MKLFSAISARCNLFRSTALVRRACYFTRRICGGGHAPKAGLSLALCLALLPPVLAGGRRAGAAAPSTGRGVTGPNYTRFACTIRSTSWTGAAKDLMNKKRANVHRIRRDGSVYRVDEWLSESTAGAPFRSLYCFKGASEVEWQYRPAQQRISPSMPTLAYQLQRNNPARAQRVLKSMPAEKPVILPRLETLLAANLADRKLDPSVQLLGKPRKVRIAGRASLEYHIKYRPLGAQPETRRTKTARSPELDSGESCEAWIALHRGLVMRQIIRTHSPDLPARDYRWRELRKEILSLDLSPRFSAATFAPPPGATFVLFDDVPVTAPPGVKTVRRPGDGFIEQGGPRVLDQ